MAPGDLDQPELGAAHLVSGHLHEAGLDAGCVLGDHVDETGLHAVEPLSGVADARELRSIDRPQREVGDAGELRAVGVRRVDVEQTADLEAFEAGAVPGEEVEREVPCRADSVEARGPDERENVDAGEVTRELLASPWLHRRGRGEGSRRRRLPGSLLESGAELRGFVANEVSGEERDQLFGAIRIIGEIDLALDRAAVGRAVREADMTPSVAVEGERRTAARGPRRRA